MNWPALSIGIMSLSFSLYSISINSIQWVLFTIIFSIPFLIVGLETNSKQPTIEVVN